MPDGYIAEHAIALLKTLAARQVNDAAGTTTTAKPFFMAVGFHKPHLPHIAPQEYFDLYPLDKVSLPDNQSRYGPQDAPDIAWNGNGEFLSYTDTKDYNKKHKIAAQEPWMNDTFVRMQRRAYMASASYTDANIGSLLKALEATGVADNTIIALWGDHGWHIGENNEWAKHTAMTWANRAPLLFAVPGLTSSGGAVSEDFAEFVDIMPTLTDFAGLPVPPRCKSVLDSQTSELCTEGASLKPVVRRLVAKTAALLETRKSTDFEPLLVSEGGKVAAFGQWPKGGKMGYIVHTRGAANAPCDARATALSVHVATGKYLASMKKWPIFSSTLSGDADIAETEALWSAGVGYTRFNEYFTPTLATLKALYNRTQRGVPTLVHAPTSVKRHPGISNLETMAIFLIGAGGKGGEHSYYEYSSGWYDNNWRWDPLWDVAYGLPTGPPVVTAYDVNVTSKTQGEIWVRKFDGGNITVSANCTPASDREHVWCIGNITWPGKDW
jgi:hypothetical protein